MPVRHASAEWKGTLKEGQGVMQLGSGAFRGNYSFGSRFEEQQGTNPEELIGAAHAGCFSMALSLALGEAGYNPEMIHTKSRVNLEKAGEGFKISDITLSTEASVPNIDEEEFKKHAEAAKKNCPVSQALKGVEIKLEANLR
ncbi:MAG: OsmC family protein [Calditrichia bacterium]